MNKQIQKMLRAVATAGTIGIMLLLLANIACAEIPISDGFDYPVGWPDHADYQISGWTFMEDEIKGKGELFHPGEDWNGDGGKDTDLGDPVYAISNGHIIAAGDYGSGWGNIIVIEHKENNSASSVTVWSNYAHLQDIIISSGYVQRGQQIGTIGKGHNDEYWAHLHFEIRINYLSPDAWTTGQSEAQVLANYTDPSVFIDSHRPKTTPLIGDWNGDEIDTNGTFNPRTSTFSLRDEDDQEVVSQQFGEPGDFPIVGDWNGNGNDSIGVYRPKTAEFYLDDNNDGTCDYDPINFGVIGDYPIVGDWDGDGKDNVGVFRSLDPITLKTTFFLKYPDKVDSIEFGAKTDFPIIGDWNNDGKDDVGVFRRNDPDHKKNAVFYLKNGAETIAIVFGNNTDIPITGKPELDGLTRIGVYRPSTKEFIFKPEPVQSNNCLDVIIAFDTTGSMGPYIADAQASASLIVAALDLTGLDYRVAIVDYRDYPEWPYGGDMDYVHNLDQPFSNDKDVIIDAINGLTLGWGADWKESVYSALVLSMLDANKDSDNADNYGWRNGAYKAIILIGDAPPQGGPESHIPEPWVGGYSLDDVAYWSETIDPIRVYSIVVGYDSNTYAAFSEISERTGGKVYLSPNADDVSDAIIKAIEDMENDGYGVEVEITPTWNKASPKDSVFYSVNITNKGDLADVYDVSFEAENIAGSCRAYPLSIQYSWISFNDSEMELDPSMSEIRSLTISVPENWAGMEDVNYTFSVNAKSKTNANVSNTTSAELKIEANKRSMIEYSKLEIQWLAELVNSSTINQGIKNALLAKLNNAESKTGQALVGLDNGKVELANNMLQTSQNTINAFSNQVEAQYDKKIMQPDAEMLKEKAGQIMEDLEEAMIELN